MSAVFWCNIALSIALAVCIIAIAPGLVWFYAEPRLKSVAIAVSGIFLVTGLSLQHQAMLRRQMRFRTIATTKVVADAAGIASALIFAANGARYWAIVVMMAVHASTYAVCMWACCDWRPSWPRRGSGVRPLLRFGGNLMAANSVLYCTRNLDNVLIAAMWGPASLGLYSKAYQLLRMPDTILVGPIRNVSISALSRLQGNLSAYRRYYRRALNLQLSLTMPVIGFLFVAARPAVNIVLGPQWADAVPIFQALSIAAFCHTMDGANSWVNISMGCPERRFRWVLIAAPIVIASFFVGLPWGPTGVAIGYSASVAALRLPGILFCLRGMPVGLSDVVAAAWCPSSATILACLIVFPIASVCDRSYGAAMSLLVVGTAFGLLYSIGVVALVGGPSQFKSQYPITKWLRLEIDT